MSGDARPQILRLAALSLAAFGAFLALYLLAVQTGIGQRADQAALAGGAQAPPRAQNAAGDLLGVVSVGGLAIAIVLLGGVAALRRRPRLVLVPAAVIGITMIAVEVFKKAIFSRPVLVDGPIFLENTYPSGHTAVAISVGLAALIVAPPRLRALVAVGAAAVAAAFGVFVVTAEWHFPSDALGAYAIALCVAGGVMALVLALTPAREAPIEVEALVGGGADPETVASRLERLGLAGGALFFGGVIVFASLRYGDAIDWNRVDAAYLGSMAAVVFWAATGYLGVLMFNAVPRIAAFDLDLLVGAGRAIAAGQGPYDPALLRGVAPDAVDLFYSYPPLVGQELGGEGDRELLAP